MDWLSWRCALPVFLSARSFSWLWVSRRRSFLRWLWPGRVGPVFPRFPSVPHYLLLQRFPRAGYIREFSFLDFELRLLERIFDCDSPSFSIAFGLVCHDNGEVGAVVVEESFLRTGSVL